MALAALVNRAGSMVFVFTPIWLVQVHGFADHDAISTVGLFGAGAILGTLIGGWLTDHIRALPVQLGTLVGMALGFVLLSRSTDPTAIRGLIFSTGLLGQAFRPANDTLLAAVCPPADRTRAFGLHRLAVNLGWAIGPALGGLLTEISWHLLFWADSLTCLLAAAVLLASFKHLDTRALGRAAPPEPARAGGPLRDPLFLAFVGCLLLAGLVLMQFFSTLSVYLSEALAWSPAEIGALQALNPILIVLLEMLIVQRLQHANPLVVVASGALMIGLGFGLLSLSPATLWIVLCMLILTLGDMLLLPFSVSFAADRATDRTRGRYLAIYGLAFSLALTGAPVLGGLVQRQYGWHALWIGSGALGVAATVGLLVLARVARR